MADQRRNAGNIGDVIKHAILPELVLAFDAAQLSNWVYCETHAGFYDYPLSLLKNGDEWDRKRARSLGVIEGCGALSQLGAYGAELTRALRAGKYPGSIRLIESLSRTSRLEKLYGWDIGSEQVASYPAASKRICVEKRDGFSSVARVDASAKLVFCDPFWKNEGEFQRVRQLVEDQRAVVVWYPLIENANRFRQWVAQQPYASLEIYHRHWTANKHGWAGQDIKGAGLMLKGLPENAVGNALSVGQTLKALFEGIRVPGKPRKGKSGQTIVPESRDLSLRVTASW